MSHPEHDHRQKSEAELVHQQLDLDVPSLETALQSSPEEHLDWHLGPGVIFRLGEERKSALELYSQVLRITLPNGQLALPRREAEVAPEGVVFQDPDRFLLSVGPQGDVLFQYSAQANREVGQEQPAPNQPAIAPESTSPLSPPRGREAKEKPKSERHLGRLGEVRTHRTKQGKLVAEVEVAVPDPERPGSHRLVKFVAFNEKAEALKREYSPGQEVVAVGIPHELRRRSKEGREWTERQLYFVQLPKVRGQEAP